MGGRQKQEAVQFKVSLGYGAKPVWDFSTVQKVLGMQKKDLFTLRNLESREEARLGHWFESRRGVWYFSVIFQGLLPSYYA